MTGALTNWAGNITFSADQFHRPSSLERLQALVAGGRRVRVLGAGHSFSRIADTPGDLVSLAGLPPVMDIDAAAGTVRVSAGVRYGELATHLHAAGLALHNLASLPHITVAGACVTATHGSGDGNGNLATAVSAIEMITAGGDLVTLSRDADGDRFNGAVAAVGCLGVLTTLTLDVRPAYEVRQYVYDALPWDRLRAHCAEVFAGAYSVSVFTDWTGPAGGPTDLKQVWRKSTTGETPERDWLGATLADGPRHPIGDLDPVNCTEQLGVPGPWYDRLPHFRLEYVASTGEELQSEYMVPREFAVEALEAVAGIRDRVAAVLQVSEIRTIAADELWLSPNYRRDSLGLHFTWVRDAPAVAPVVAALEERLAPYGARPHWGKIFGMPPEVVAGLYERYPDFLELVREYDPAGKFANETTDRYFPRG